MEEPDVGGDDDNPLPPLPPLPPEMLVKIFSEVGETRSPRVREVCQMWKESFDYDLELQLEVSNFNWKDLKNCKNSKMNVNFSTLTKTLDLTDEPTMDFLLRIRAAKFTVHLVSYNLATCLKHCVNLESLILSQCRLLSGSDPRHIEEFSIEEILLPRLKTVDCRLSTFDKEEVGHLFILLKQVLINTKPAHFNLNISIHRYYIYDDLFQLILRRRDGHNTVTKSKNAQHIHAFLTDHLKTIQSISFKSEYGGPVFWIRSTENPTWPLQVEEVNTGGWGAGLFVQLSDQQHLTKLMVPANHNWSSWSELSDHIGIISARLTEISFNFSNAREYSYDCQTFQSCVSLRKLSFYRERPRVHHNHYLINCHLLPSSLRYLKTSATPNYTGSTFRDIPFENLKQLENLELGCHPYFRVGDEDEIWMDQANFHYMLKTLSNLSKIKLQVTNGVTSIPEEFVRHIENTPGLHFAMGDQNKPARIDISAAFRTDED